MHLKHWDKAVELLTELVQKTPDQWSHMKQYIRCQIMRCYEMRKRCVAEESAVVASEKVSQTVVNGGTEEDVEESEGHGDISPPEEDDSVLGAESPGKGTTSECAVDPTSFSWTSLM